MSGSVIFTLDGLIDCIIEMIPSFVENNIGRFNRFILDTSLSVHMSPTSYGLFILFEQPYL